MIFFWKEYFSRKTHGIPDRVFRFSTELEYTPKFYADFNWEENHKILEWEYEALFQIKNVVYNIISCILIAKGGILKPANGIIYQDMELKENTIGFHNEFLYVRYDTLKYNWVRLQNLKMKKVWKWYSDKISSESFVSNNKIELAFNAISHILNSGGNHETLFWSMVALEALYVTGINGITEQMKEKVQLYLGKMTEYKNMLSKMYDFRSKFVHGKTNIPSAYFELDIDEKDNEYEKFSNESNKVLNFAQLILLATLQKLILEDRIELEFELKLK